MEPIYIAGPTASGKSAVALFLARNLGGEIISVDSMQVYRGMDIGTAKPTAAERACVAHHLVDVAGPQENFDVARFLHMAAVAHQDIVGRNRVPIYCGGTGLYFNALIYGVGTAPASDPGIRQELESAPLDDLLAELARQDPETFARIDRSNRRRVVRALEVIRTTGKPYSDQRAEWKVRPPGHWFGLARERSDLHQRINARVDAMFAHGLVEETRELLRHGLEGNRTAMQAIGYRQVVEHLNGDRDLPSTIELVKQKTRQFAKRQGTWFRNQLELNWLNIGVETAAEEIADTVLRKVSDR